MFSRNTGTKLHIAKEKERLKGEITAIEEKLEELELERNRLVQEHQTLKDSLASLENECITSPPPPPINTAMPPSVSPNSYPMCVGKYDFNGTEDGDLSFNKGDVMYIIEMYGENWWFARSKDSGKVGHIPSNYVTEWKSLDAEEWFFGGIKSVEAERLLMQPFNSLGSFMVRYSDTASGKYFLSVRGQEKVKHYHILSLEDGALYISRRVSFKNLQELVAHYSQQADGLCVNLKQPCLTSERSQTAGLSKEEWEVDRHQLQFVRRLGVGQFGDVWEGLWNNSSVAVKVLKPESYQNEVGLMKKIRHQNLIQLYAMCTKEEPIYIITELMKHGSLMEYLRGEGRSLKLPQLIDICAQVANGMVYFEEHNYIHRDLAARNILVGDNMICKVANFGLAQDLTEDIYDMPTEEKFPIKWMAPEAAMYNRFTIKSDVWSFGIVLYEVITYGNIPYPGMSNGQVLKVLQQGYRMPRPMRCPNELYDMMLDCWMEDPIQRPTFGTLHRHLEELFSTNNEGSCETESLIQ